jgi:hypothetical protein
MAKKGKKGKKGKKDVVTGPQPFTTTQIVHDRTKMLCPRMGDVYGKSMNVEIILEVLLLNLGDSTIILRVLCLLGCC